MACASIHLAIGKQYLKHHKSLDNKKFLAGTLFPDATPNKDIAHYTDKNRGKDNISHLRGKVNLYTFLQEHPSLDDFELGWFLHLVTDYLFFDECFTTEYLLETTYEEFRKDLYYAYSHLDLYISQKYNITKEDYEAYPSEYYPGKTYMPCLLTKEQIDKFINRISSIYLEDYILKLKKNKKNVKP